MYEQLSIFDFIEEKDKKFCFDDDINYIVDRLDEIVSNSNCKAGKKNFLIWDHVPKYGYRLEYQIKIKKGNEGCLIDKIDRLVDEARERKVELSPMWGAMWFLDGDEGTLYCFTTFMDNRRKIRKE